MLACDGPVGWQGKSLLCQAYQNRESHWTDVKPGLVGIWKGRDVRWPVAAVIHVRHALAARHGIRTQRRRKCLSMVRDNQDSREADLWLTKKTSVADFGSGSTVPCSFVAMVGLLISLRGQNGIRANKLWLESLYLMEKLVKRGVDCSRFASVCLWVSGSDSVWNKSWLHSMVLGAASAMFLSIHRRLGAALSLLCSLCDSWGIISYHRSRERGSSSMCFCTSSFQEEFRALHVDWRMVSSAWCVPGGNGVIVLWLLSDFTVRLYIFSCFQRV